MKEVNYKMSVQTIQLNNGRQFKIMSSSVPVTHELIGLVHQTLEERFADPTLQTLAWGPITGSDKSCIVTLQCANYNAVGSVTMTCPSSPVAAGASFTISITAKNDNTVSGKFVIGISNDKSLTPTSYPAGGSVSQSPIISLAASASSAPYTWTFTMPTPAVNVGIVCNLSCDPDQNCT